MAIVSGSDLCRTVAKVQVKSASLHRLCDYLSASTENAATSSSDGADELTPEEALRQKVLLEDTEMEQEETMGASAGTAGETRPAGEAINAVESTFTLEKLTPFLQDLEPSQTSSSKRTFNDSIALLLLLLLL